MVKVPKISMGTDGKIRLKIIPAISQGTPQFSTKSSRDFPGSPSNFFVQEFH